MNFVTAESSILSAGTFELAVTEWAKTLRLPRTAAAAPHTKTRDRRAHHHESSCHCVFFWNFDEAVPLLEFDVCFSAVQY